MGITKIKLKKEELVKIVAATFPECTLADYEELTEGLCNTAYRMVLSNGQKVVFRRSKSYSNKINHPSISNTTQNAIPLSLRSAKISPPILCIICLLI